MSVDLNQIQSVYFVGIKGVAMAALAIIAKERGLKVSGVDVAEIFPTDTVLKRFVIPVDIGFEHSLLPAKLDLVIFTGAHGGITNPLVVAAQKRGIPVLPQGKALGLFMQDKRQISVSGSHGKTTTSAMIASVLAASQVDPSFAIGCGEILHLNTPAHAGAGEWFVAEGDEYVTDPTSDRTPRFMWQNPEIAVVTNLDYDHPDVYPNIEAVSAAFLKFCQKVPQKGSIILNADDPQSLVLQKRLNRGVTFGSNEMADYRLLSYEIHNHQSIFQVKMKRGKTGVFTLSVPGRHNLLNATAAISCLDVVGIPVAVIEQGLATFKGTKRRFELIAEKDGKLLFDDYAHHPTEIAATIAAARKWYPHHRLVVIFQPHTYSRTQALLSDFVQSLGQADVPVVVDIYASAREQPIAGVSGRLLYEKILATKKGVQFRPNKAAVLEYIHTQTRENDLIITMGAGDIFGWLEDIKKVF